MPCRGLPAGEGVREPSDCGLDDRSLDGPGAGLRAEEYGAYEDIDAREREAAEPPERPTIGGRRMSLAVKTGYSEFESPSFGSVLVDGGGDGEADDDDEGSFAGGPRWMAGLRRGSIGPSGGRT